MAKHRYQKGQSGNPNGRPKGLQNKATREIKEFWGKFFESAEYRDNAKRRILKGKAPHLEKELLHYVYGVPRETLKIEGEIPSLCILRDDGDGE